MFDCPPARRSKTSAGAGSAAAAGSALRKPIAAARRCACRPRRSGWLVACWPRRADFPRSESWVTATRRCTSRPRRRTSAHGKPVAAARQRACRPRRANFPRSESRVTAARRCTYLPRRANFRARKACPAMRWHTCPTRRANFPRSESWVTAARRRTYRTRRTNFRTRKAGHCRAAACLSRSRRVNSPRWRADSLPRSTVPSARGDRPPLARSDIVRARKAGVPDSACAFPSLRTRAEGSPSAARMNLPSREPPPSRPFFEDPASPINHRGGRGGWSRRDWSVGPGRVQSVSDRVARSRRAELLVGDGGPLAGARSCRSVNPTTARRQLRRQPDGADDSALDDRPADPSDSALDNPTAPPRPGRRAARIRHGARHRRQPYGPTTATTARSTAPSTGPTAPTTARSTVDQRERIAAEGPRTRAIS